MSIQERERERERERGREGGREGDWLTFRMTYVSRKTTRLRTKKSKILVAMSISSTITTMNALYIQPQVTMEKHS